MSQPLPLQTFDQPLLNELRWLVRLRWFAGVAVIIGVTIMAALNGWDLRHAWALGLGLAILAYNLPFWIIVRSRQPQHRTEPTLLTMAWLQIGLDLVCLTIVTQWTGGVASPLRGLFILHMVLASLLLSRANSYLAAGVAVVMVLAGLLLSDTWPSTGEQWTLLVAWALVLFLTVFLASHITSDLRKQHTKVRDHHEQLRAVLDTAADGIITIDQRGIIESTNAAADRIFGYKAGELIGRNVKTLMPEPYHGNHDQYVRNFLDTRVPRIIGIGREVEGKRKDGSTFPLDLAVSEVSLHGRTTFTGILRDITQRRTHENELVTLNQTLQKHQQAMIQQEKMAAMGQMAAGIVHEISNPLACMDSVLQLVERHPNKFDHSTIGTLQEQMQRIHRITRELTGFAHPNETAWEMRSLNAMVEGALEMIRFDHRIRKVQIERDLDPHAGDVRVMPPAFQQVLLNMMLNALDAMTDSNSPQLRIGTSGNKDWRVVEIADNGHGIAREHLSQIFEPFFTTKPLGQGTGLGLSISYNLIQRHGGRCEVHSEVGRGTTFRIMLPTVAGDAT